MDQAAKPILIAAVGILAFSLIILGVRAGDDDTAPTGDGASAAGQTDTDEPVAAPDFSTEPTPAPEPTEEPEPEPEPTEDATAAPDSDGTDDGGAPDTDADGDGSAQDDALDGLDDMPQTGGGALAALGGLVAAGAAGGLARRR